MCRQALVYFMLSRLSVHIYILCYATQRGKFHTASSCGQGLNGKVPCTGAACPGGDHVDHIGDLHDLAEEIYWDSRERASAERRALSRSAVSGPATTLRFDLRVWDFFYPKYNCPLLKERIGRLGESVLHLFTVRMRHASLVRSALM